MPRPVKSNHHKKHRRKNVRSLVQASRNACHPDNVQHSAVQPNQTAKPTAKIARIVPSDPCLLLQKKKGGRPTRARIQAPPKERTASFGRLSPTSVGRLMPTGAPATLKSPTDPTILANASPISLANAHAPALSGTRVQETESARDDDGPRYVSALVSEAHKKGRPIKLKKKKKKKKKVQQHLETFKTINTTSNNVGRRTPKNNAKTNKKHKHRATRPKKILPSNVLPNSGTTLLSKPTVVVALQKVCVLCLDPAAPSLFSSDQDTMNGESTGSWYRCNGNHTYYACEKCNTNLLSQIKQNGEVGGK